MSALPALLEIIKKTTGFLSSKGVESSRHDAEMLIGHALGLKRMQLYLQFERPLAEAELELIRPLVRRRGNREPLQHILGTTEFAGMILKTDKRALIPRPETEYLVEILVQRFPTPPGQILDLGTGTGVIALALANAWPAAQITAVEKSPEALALARDNAVGCNLAERVRFVESDWFSSLSTTDCYDLIVANPPYLSDAETDATAPEVRTFEPRTSLSAGPDGKEDLIRIIQSANSFLRPGGLLALETGVAQHSALCALFANCGYTTTESLHDLTGRERYVLAAL